MNQPAYDFHLHSCLSPCGDDDMTPYNLVNMASLLGYGVIALTDHNTVGNCAAAVAAGKQAGVTVIPGMELCTAEEIHVVCLFSRPEQAAGFGEQVRESLPPVKNKPGVFGRQLYMDERDKILGEEETLLVTASGISIEEAPGMVVEWGGICYPAHIDRASFSILSSLGAVPPELGFACYELGLGADGDALRAGHPILEGMRQLYGSDAHRLEDMREPEAFLPSGEADAPHVLAYLRGLA